MLTPSGRSDLAVRLWEYVLADPEAKAWLDGTPDQSGMIVNPWYSTNPEVNPTGAGSGVAGRELSQGRPGREARYHRERSSRRQRPDQPGHVAAVHAQLLRRRLSRAAR